MAQALLIAGIFVGVLSFVVLGWTYLDEWIDRRLEEAWRSDKFLTDNDRDAIQ